MPLLHFNERDLLRTAHEKRTRKTAEALIEAYRLDLSGLVVYTESGERPRLLRECVADAA